MGSIGDMFDLLIGTITNLFEVGSAAGEGSVDVVGGSVEGFGDIIQGAFDS